MPLLTGGRCRLRLPAVGGPCRWGGQLTSGAAARGEGAVIRWLPLQVVSQRSTAGRGAACRSQKV